MGVRPLLVACAAFLAGAFFGVSLAWWAAVAALPLAFWRPARAAAAGLALGLLRGAAQEQAVPFALEEEFEGVVVSPDDRYAFVSVEGGGTEPGTVEMIDLAALKKVTEERMHRAL